MSIGLSELKVNIWFCTYTDSVIIADMVLPWAVKQSSCIFSDTIAGFRFKSLPYHYVPGWLESRVTGVPSVVDSAIDTGFYKLLSVFANLYTLHMPTFHIPTVSNCRNNSKTVPISLCFVDFECGFVYISAILVCFTSQLVHFRACGSHYDHQQAVSRAVNCERV